MSRRARVLLYGSCGVLAMVAVLAVIVFAGTTGEAVSISAGSLSGIGLISLLFMEIGLSEDREREAARRLAAEQQKPDPAAPKPRRRVSGPPRRRG